MPKTHLVRVHGSRSDYEQQPGDAITRAADPSKTISALILLHPKTPESELTEALKALAAA